MHFWFVDNINKKYFVNEIQALFGNIKSENIYLGKEYMGRYIHDYKKKIWKFEEGNFYKNACANLRVEYLLKILSGKNK